jgi:hypothetical protein
MMASMLARGASRLSRHHRTGWISSFGGFSTHRGFSTGEDRGPSTGDGTIPDGGCEPTFKGAYCESVAVELGTERTPVNVGFETGRVARLTNGAIIASMGDSRVICAAVCSRDEDPDAGFFPLQVDYRERQSAYGKIPPTFTRREGPPKDREVLAMRVVDRAIRPLFPKSFSRETSVPGHRFVHGPVAGSRRARGERRFRRAFGVVDTLERSRGCGARVRDG